MVENQYDNALENRLEQPVQLSYECECADKKKYKLVFDGATIGKYAVEYCQRCYDSDDKQFLVSTEELF